MKINYKGILNIVLCLSAGGFILALTGQISWAVAILDLLLSIVFGLIVIFRIKKGRALNGKWLTAFTFLYSIAILLGMSWLK